MTGLNLNKQKLEEKIKEFHTLQDNTSRIKFTFALCEELYDLVTSTPKSLKKTEELKSKGNKLFAEKNNLEALKLYNEALKLCPQDDLEHKKLYAILIANRSAVFFDNAEFDKVLLDVVFLKQDGNHPNLDKIKTRETNALEAIKQNKTKQNRQTTTTLVNSDNSEELNWCSGNKIYPALTHKVTLQENEVMGRYVVATEDIKTGEIIAVEKPYASVITSCNNCEYCALSTNQIYVCPQCTTVYCSQQCLDKAVIYHQHECDVLLKLSEAKVDNGFLLSLRMITKRSLQQVLNDVNNTKQNKPMKDYQSADYYHVSRLVGHEELPGSLACFNNILWSTLLLKLLKTTTYFGVESKKNELSDENILVAQLMLKYLQIRQCNAHEIYELRYDTQSNEVCKTKIGSGLYTTISLFNHSCDPSVTRSNLKDVLILRCVKPIKAGDIVYENYGCDALVRTKPERLVKLNDNYRFTCECQACTEDWPMFKDLDEYLVNILCDCGTVIHTSKDLLSQPVKCLKCKKKKVLIKTFKGLEDKLKKVKKLFDACNFVEAQKMYAEILDIEFGILKQPNVDIAHAQAGLRICIQHSGNKSFDYYKY